jgi:magnesium-transporting ATPase (P-type)
VVVATGDNAEIGKINKMVSQVREEAARFLYWLFNLTGRRVGSLSLQA